MRLPQDHVHVFGLLDPHDPELDRSVHGLTGRSMDAVRDTGWHGSRQAYPSPDPRSYKGPTTPIMADEPLPPPDNATPHSAVAYDADVRRTIPYYDEVHEEVLSFIEALPQRPRTWLDTGCGTGTLVACALPRFPETRFVVADPSPAMLAVTRQRLLDSRVTVLPPCGTSDLPAGSFDVVTAIQCHHYLDPCERRAAVAACFDRLRPGGVFVTSENVRPLSRPGLDLGLRRWARFQERTGRSRSQVAAQLARFDREYHPITLEEHLQLYRETGFVAVEVLWYSYLQAAFYAVKGDA
jgi:tRNA (cmo5U34)-methyltransferase